ncbi:MAG: hypothetical protein AB1668_03295 [Nanoarchaeota archaeon]
MESNKLNKRNLKIIGFVVLGILILNLVLFALRIINALVFWVVIAFGAVFVWLILPKMKEN